MSYDRDVQAFDDRAAWYESGRHGQLHKEMDAGFGGSPLEPPAAAAS
jgi:hypothetical protein